MEPSEQLLALRFGGQSHALEPGRDYLIGSSNECDLQIAGAAPQHARLCVASDRVTIYDLGSAPGLLHNEVQVSVAQLTVGDRIAIAGEIIIVIADDGNAALIPIAAMRNAAGERRNMKIRGAAAALRHQERTFAEAVSNNLREAPWLALSVLLHAVLILLVAILLPKQRGAGNTVASFNVDISASTLKSDNPPAPPEIVIEEDQQSLIEDPDPLEEEEALPILDQPPLPPDQPRENPTLTTRKRLRENTQGGDAADVEGIKGSSSFKEKVAELQTSGLEIVFVFDSTGSMTQTIHETKSTIVEMCGVLRALVPSARIGLVTYRDHGDKEEYLVRAVPLAQDPWRVSNFVQHVNAAGGGDRPEAVRAGLKAAIEQQWRPRSQRVVVVAGDAPTHKRDLGGMLRDVQQFTKDQRSVVHTLITNPNRAGRDTHEQFRRIAKRGNGVCEPISNHSQIMQRVLTLAFGQQFDQDIDEVMRDVAARRGRLNTRSRYLARKAGPQLAAALRQQPIPDALWEAMVRKPRQDIAIVLLDLLADQRTPPHTRHAVAAALQRILELDTPPINPQTNTPASPRRIARLRAKAKRLPD